MGLIGNLQQLISEAHAIVSSFAAISPTNYSELQQAVVQKELVVEVAKLQGWAENPTVEGFEGLCAERERQNRGTCLSFSAMLEGTCNALYWDIAKVISEPDVESKVSLSRMLSILLPSIKYSLEIDYRRFNNAKKMTDTEVLLDSQPIQTLNHRVNSSAVLKRFVINGAYIFNMEQLVKLPFWVHHKLFLLNTLPLYEWNHDLKKLQLQINMIEQNGVTPRERIARLIKEFFIAGKMRTGNDEAAISGKIAYENFKEYFASLPDELRNALLPLKDNNGYSFSEVMEDLRRGECLEVAAIQFTGILANPVNKSVLDCRPRMSETELNRIKDYYNNCGIEVEGQDATQVIPAILKKSILKNVVLKSQHGFIDLLLLLPIEEYFTFLQDVTIEDTQDLLRGLAAAFAVDLFRHDQVSEFFRCLLKLKEKFGGLLSLLLFALISKKIPLQEMLNSFSKEELASLVTKRDENNYGILHYVAELGTVEDWRAVLLLYSLPLSPEIINEKDKKDWDILRHTAFNPDPYVFEAVLELYPLDKRVTVLEERASLEEGDGYLTFLHMVARTVNVAVLRAVLASYPTDDARWQALHSINGGYENKTPLNFAVTHSTHEMVQAILDYYEPHAQLEMLERAGIDKKTLLHQAVGNPNVEVIKLVLSLYPSNEEKLVALKKVDDGGKTPLHYAVLNSNPAVFNTLLELYSSLDEKKKTIEKTQDSRGCSLLVSAAQNPNVEILKGILALYTPAEQLKLAKEKNKVNRWCLGNMLLHFAMINSNPEALRIVLNLYPPKERASALKNKNKHGRSPLHVAAKNENPEVLSGALACLHSQEERLAAIKEKDKGGRNLLYLACGNPNPEVLTDILSFFPLDERLVALKEKDKDGRQHCTTPILLPP